MSRIEVDELAALWADAADPREEQLAESLAVLASRRGVLLRWADLGGALAIAGGIAVLTLREGGNSTALSAMLVLMAVAWSTWKRQTLRDLELGLGASGGESLLSEAARSARLRLKRTNVSLVLVLPAFLAALLFGYRLRGSPPASFEGSVALVLADPAWYLGWFGFVAALMIYLARSRKRLLREIAGIAELTGQYGEEARLDSLPLGGDSE